MIDVQNDRNELIARADRNNCTSVELNIICSKLATPRQYLDPSIFSQYVITIHIMHNLR